MGEFVRIAGVDDVKPGHGIVTEVQGKTLALFNVDGIFRVVDNTCIHRGGPLGEGDLEGSVVTCPWHGWQFNVTTGECVKNPSAKVEVYEVMVEGNDVKVRL
ncbi:MAG TPA: Rieske 2Fe-2S domain-containing protein [Nitrospira sp.]|nr:Rieske 2Fe-2S domain-containing protein [Nitrospira sp.]